MEKDEHSRILSTLLEREEIFLSKLAASAATGVPKPKLHVFQRCAAVEWMKRVTKTFSLDCEVLLSAVCIFDRILLAVTVPLSTIQNYALASILISSKIVGLSERSFEMVKKIPF